MQSNTSVLVAPATFVITASMNIQQFSIIGLSATTAFSYEGGAPLNNSLGVPITPQPIPFTGMVAYNSKPASNGSYTWDKVTISVTAGSVGLELTQS